MSTTLLQSHDLAHGYEFGAGPRVIDIYDDFSNGLNTDTTTGLGRWFFLETNAGATQIVDIAEGRGALKITHSSNDNEVVSLQRNVGVLTSQVAPGTPIRWGCRFKHTNVDDTDLHIGLSIQDVSITASEPADHCMFRLQESDASGALELRVGKDSVYQDVTGIVTLADSTWVRAFFEFWPTTGNLDTGTLNYIVHSGGTRARGSITLTNTFPDDVLIVPTIQVQSGNNAGTDSLYVNWVRLQYVLAEYTEGTG